MSAPFLRLLDELATAVREEDYGTFYQRTNEAWQQAQTLGADELTAGIELLAPLLIGCGGYFAKTAVLVGALVDRGGSPLPLREILPRRAMIAMDMGARFPELWGRATGGGPLPDRAGRLADTIKLQRRFMDSAELVGVPADECLVIALSWFDTDDWLRAMTAVLARREFRAAMVQRDGVRKAADALARKNHLARWVCDLTLVLDDEPLVALDPASGRGFRLTMSGVGDNFQLYTLLADRLIGPGLLAGERPLAAWVAAATMGDPGLGHENPAIRRFRAFDGHGSYVYPEGRPADIRPLDGTRVVVLHPPRVRHGWVNGRVFQEMEPEMTLDGELSAAEAADWLARVAPPKAPA